MPSPHDSLSRALDEDQLALHYQPIQDARDLRIVCAEALLRLKRGDGEVGAAQLAAAAERGPRIFHLDEWTLVTAFEHARRWFAEGLDVRLNVNLSTREFQERDFVRFFDKLVAKTGIDQKRLNLEVTEKSFIWKPKAVARVLHALKERGVQLWLDDFGTGHSSIAHLKQFPVDGIKIPSQYVLDIAENRVSRAIVSAVSKLATDLGISLIAEGVETPAQLEIVNASGCHWIQGYLLKRPMPLDELIDAFRAGHRRSWRE